MKRKANIKRFVPALLSLVVIFAFTCMVGSPLLTRFPLGSDTPSHLAKIHYLDQYYPHFPSWYYKEGCGYPFLMVYSPLSYYITFFIHKLFFISIFEAFNLAWFSSILLAGIGVYFFAKVKFRTEVTALSSSIFYLSYPLIWTMETLGGFFAETFAVPFSIFALIFLTLYQDKGTKRYLILATLSYTFLILIHTLIAFATTIVLSIYAMTRVLAKEVSPRVGILSIVKIVSLGLGLSSFWFIPFMSATPLATYTYTTLRESVDFFYFIAILPTILGFTGQRGGIFGYSSFSVYMSVFILLGAFLTLKSRRFSFWMLLLNVILVAFLFEYLFFQVKADLDPILRFNFLIVIFLSTLAGLGVTEAGRFLSRIHLVLKLDSRKDKVRQTVGLVNAILSIALIALVFGLSLSHVYNPRSWGGFPVPSFSLSETNYNIAKEISNHIEGDAFTRLDISPDLGGALEALPLVSNVSQVSTYFFSGSLIRPWWGYQSGVFYGSLGGKTELRTLSRWFGVQYVAIAYPPNPIWKYQNNSFTEVWHDGVVYLLRNDNATGLVSVGDQPVVLVIGNEELNAYEPVLKVLIMSGVDPEDAYLVHGSSYVDDYSFDELTKFDAVILHGYGYRDSIKAWKLLQDYADAGGGLFIETGWQYANPDWNSSNIPTPCPVETTTWTNFGKQWHFSYINTSIVNEISFNAFSPPIWGEEPWSFSVSNNQSVRNGAYPVLWNNGYPIVVAGTYGKGRVVWSGMNLIPHATGNENAEESRLFARILNWMIDKKGVTNYNFKAVRHVPEEVMISIFGADENTNVLFREAYFQNWHAYVQKDNFQMEMKIYKAGPDLMLVKVPLRIDAPFTVVFAYGKSYVDWSGISVTLVSLSVLAIYALSAKVPRKTVWVPSEKVPFTK